jgi:outer membrane lipoprotein SlyB
MRFCLARSAPDTSIGINPPVRRKRAPLCVKNSAESRISFCKLLLSKINPLAVQLLYCVVCVEVCIIMTIKRNLVFASGMLALTLGGTEITAAPADSDVQYRYAVANSANQPQYVQVVTRRYRSRYVVKRRSKKKSAAIVAGSAAGGAAIGALAGGGKGAAIGAIAGGGAGFIYDRKTHKKVVRQY